MTDRELIVKSRSRKSDLLGILVAMRKLALLFVLLAVSPVAQAGASRTGHVAVVDRKPFTVRGGGFLPNERVTLVVFAGGRHVRMLKAGARGGFRSVFSGLLIGACEAYALRATGDQGTVATLKATPECAPSADPGAGYPVDPVPKKP